MHAKIRDRGQDSRRSPISCSCDVAYCCGNRLCHSLPWLNAEEAVIPTLRHENVTGSKRYSRSLLAQQPTGKITQALAVSLQLRRYVRAKAMRDVLMRS